MKDDKIYLEHIMDSLQKILDYTESHTFDLFLNDAKTQEFCICQLEVTGKIVEYIYEEQRYLFKKFNDKLL